jgi:hypothetical protein
MQREIRKLNKKIDELQKLVNHNSDCIMDQSIIIQKLIEKLVGHSPYLDERFTGPIKPKEPYINPTPYNNNVTCLHCGKNTGIPMLLHMVISPEGLKCPHCGRTAVYSNSPTCQEPFSIKAVPADTGTNPTMPWQTVSHNLPNSNTSVYDPNIKAYNSRETTPITHTSYDGTKSTLPVTVPEKWTATQVNDFMWKNRHNF